MKLPCEPGQRRASRTSLRQRLTAAFVGLLSLVPFGCGNTTTSLAAESGGGGGNGAGGSAGDAGGSGGLGTPTWPQRAGGFGLDAGRALVTAADGSFYVVGHFSDKATFPGAALNTHPGTVEVLVRYRADGTLDWAAPAITEPAYLSCLAVTPEGGLYRAFGEHVIKYAVDGSVLWASDVAGSIASAIAVGADGTFQRVGRFSDTSTFGTITLTSLGPEDIFVEKRAADGTVLWVQQAGGDYSGDRGNLSPDSAFSSAVLEDGSSVVSGQVASRAQFGPISLEAEYGHDFLARYEASGALLWARLVDTGYQLAAGPGVSFYALDLGWSETLVTRFTLDGSVAWTAQEAGAAQVHGAGLSVGTDGAIYVTGYFEVGATFGGVMATPRGSEDMFVAKYSVDGALLWVNTGGGSVSITDILADFGAAVAVDPHGSAYVTGRFRGEGHFGSTRLESEGNSDLFLLRYDAATGIER